MNSKNKFKIELHAHNYEESCDSLLTGKELIDAVKEEGYNGIIITNHYGNYTFGALKNKKPCNPKNIDKCKDCSNCYLSKTILTFDLIYEGIKEIYKIRKELSEYGDSIGIKVYFGNEWENKTYLDFPTEDVPNYLVHLLLIGQTNEEFLKNPPIPCTDFKTLLEWKNKTNSLIILNHANRYLEEYSSHMFTDYPDLIDGYEVYNSKHEFGEVDVPKDISGFIIDKIGEERYNKTIKLSGGDIHKKIHLGKSGLILPYLPIDERDLQKLLISGDFDLIKK